MSPLKGRTILVLRAEHQQDTTQLAVEKKGAKIIAMPTIAIAFEDDHPVIKAQFEASEDALLRPILILTSVNAVKAFKRNITRSFLAETIIERAKKWDIYLVGPKTKRALDDVAGFEHSIVAKDHRAEGLASILPDDLSGRHILMPRAEKVRDILPTELKKRGGILFDPVVYRTVLSDPSLWQKGLNALNESRVDAILITSGSTIRNLMTIIENKKELLNKPVLAAIGPVAADVAQALGLNVDVVADPYTIDALLDALERYFRVYKGD